MAFVERQSPYLDHADRLADVIAAIQVMGTYKYASREIARWEETIGRKPRSAESWSAVFGDHPEFFRIQDDKVMLVWRRAYERVFDVNQGKEISPNEIAALSQQEKETLSRIPLSAVQITALIEIAIKLQTQAIARRQELRWLVPVVVGALGVLIGALIKG